MPTRSGAGFQCPQSGGAPQGDGKRRRRSSPPPTARTPTQSCGAPACLKQLGEEDEHFVLRPCNHILCTLCAFKSQVERCSLPQRCPVCAGYPESCVYVGKDARQEVPNKASNSIEYTRVNIPQLCVYEQHKDGLKKGDIAQAVALTINTVEIRSGDGNNRYYHRDTVTSMFALRKDRDAKDKNRLLHFANPAQAFIEMQAFGAALHATVLKPSLEAELLPILSPRELLELRCSMEGRRVLDALLYGMATGEVEFDGEKFLRRDVQDDQRQFCSTIAAADLLLQNVRDKPGYFQLLLFTLMEKQRLTRNFSDLLSAFRLAPSRAYAHSDQIQKVLDNSKHGLKIGPRDLVILLFDNVGFKVLGRQAGYDQYTIFNVVIITEAQLKSAGFYRDDDASNRISRKRRHTWRDRIKNVSTDEEKTQLARQVFGINATDYEILSTCVLEDILFAIDYGEELVAGNRSSITKLPRFDRIVNELTRDIMDRLSAVGDSATSSTLAASTQSQASAGIIPRNYLPRDVDDGLEIAGPGLLNSVRDNGLEDDSGAVVGENRYGRNGTKLQVEKIDLSAKSSVDAIMQYSVTFAENQLAEWRRTKHKYPADAEEPIASTIIGLGCDGQPAAQAQRILFDEYEVYRYGNDSAYPEHLFVSPGGFHMVLKLLNVNGEIFEDILREIVGAWRNSTDKVNFFIWPNDPNQRKLEEKWFQLASNHVAVQHLKKTKGDKVTAVEVDDFMLERARQYPLCALFLLENRASKIVKLMINSERMGDQTGCVKHFFSAMRLAMPLFAVTHKTDYMMLCTELLIWYDCASDAERLIYERFIFTRLTANGKSCFHDLFVELSVMDTRQVCGRVSVKGLETKLKHAAATIPTVSGRDSSAQTLRGNAGGTSRHRTCVNLSNDPMYCQFYSAVEKLEAMRIWSDEPPRIKRKGRGDHYDICDGEILSVPGGELDASILESHKIGVDRTQEYGIYYCIDNYGKSTRTQAEVDLSKRDMTVDSIKQSMERAMILGTSVKSRDFQPKWCTIALIKKEIDSHCQDLQVMGKDSIEAPSLRKVSSKHDMISALIKFRKKIFDDHPGVRQDIETRISEKFEKARQTTKKSRVELLKSTLFRLSDSVRSLDRYNAK